MKEVVDGGLGRLLAQSAHREGSLGATPILTPAAASALSARLKNGRLGRVCVSVARFQKRWLGNLA
eukprot:CAMPEP_0185605320 /NCGR_PEP_ID=MMETSP0436-20130131/3952_1 /TAXON_ID=626734 ORGANISM="Favella taraikaensis, Strain Fe Narragansett Bay" /NCGR_SAMPLE_ID=MMETSP0436 /ASSEMBLY_ACC=CAM_ASM_000390 /LENGTH=65 /DNA_ID=CAMNT_0028236475 /DNA_START=61 /DNA_END=258 /DNA_ORIENTATION=+